jgi:hypothetical protein
MISLMRAFSFQVMGCCPESRALAFVFWLALWYVRAGSSQRDGACVPNYHLTSFFLAFAEMGIALTRCRAAPIIFFFCVSLCFRDSLFC